MKSAFLGLCLILLPSLQAAQVEVPEGWHLKSYEESERYGISLPEAYELLKGKKSKTVIVAVIDSGIDVEHEDLADIMWVNEDEVAGDGKDNDGNGYIDDVHGWNFLGGKDGDVSHETLEMTRLYRKLKPKYDGKERDDIKKKERAEFDLYQEVKKDFEESVAQANGNIERYKDIEKQYGRFEKLIRAYLDKGEDEEITPQDLLSFESSDSIVSRAQALLAAITMAGLDESYFGETIEYFQGQLDYNLNPDFNARDIIGDNFADKKEKIYGNNNYEGPDARHGTHVGGIIAAIRGNDLGAEGVADNVRIMTIRAVPDGDEYDKDVANAIYYAVDNGAQIINMSFGKAYSPEKSVVDEAARYAESKGVLLVHAAGNDGKDTDQGKNFPHAEPLKGKSISTWLEIGASSWGTEDALVASFSNYAQKRVDLFAPGTEIYSTVPDDKYENLQGTSMAAPVVSGVAALLMSYFPELSAKDVKEILMDSATDLGDMEIVLPGSDRENPTLVKFKELSKTGGIVNAKSAVEMAQKKTGK
ncbi:MAG: S8 family peptidase [Bacteroidota bacterium]